MLRATFSSFPDYLDPALSHSEEGWTAIYDTYVPLLTYRHADGKAGSEVIPGLARSLPEISEDGLDLPIPLTRRVALLRTANRSSPPTSRRAVERVFVLNSSGSPFFTGIVGAD